MHLKSLDIAPPGNYRHQCKYCSGEPPIVLVGITFAQLIQRVQHHNHNMQHPLANVAEEVETAICAALSPADQVAYCETGVRARSGIGWSEVLDFFTWLAKWWTSGHELVPQTEAERRAAICANCPYNVPVTGCGVCQTSVGIMRNKVLKVSTSLDTKLAACGVCGCDLRTIVHVPNATLQHRGLGEQFAKVPWCWQNDPPADGK